jgi:tetratricopeptide (TPR) repeat protein
LKHRARKSTQAYDSADWQELFADVGRPGGRIDDYRQAPGEQVQPPRPLAAVLAAVRCRAVLAEVYSAYGQHGKAEEIYKGAIADVENLAGPRHRQSLRNFSGLAELYLGLGRYDEAAPLLEQAYARLREASGDAHPDVALSLAQLAECRRGQGRLDECEALYLEALDILESALGNEHFLVARVKIALGRLWCYLGRFDRAERVYAEAIVLKRNLTAFDHPASSDTLAGLAELALCLGRLTEAEQLSLQAMSLLQQPAGPAQEPTRVAGNQSVTAAEGEFAGGACRPWAGGRLTGHESEIDDKGLQVLNMTAQGCDTGEMSRTLGVSPGAARAALGSLLAKLASLPAQAAQVKLYNLIAR